MKICFAGVDNPAGRLAAPVPAPGPRDIDVLWVSLIDRLQRPDRVLSLARRLPQARLHMAGGPLSGEETLYRAIRHMAGHLPNLAFHSPLPYEETDALYGRAKLLLNTSDEEGFPDSYLQA